MGLRSALPFGVLLQKVGVGSDMCAKSPLAIISDGASLRLSKSEGPRRISHGWVHLLLASKKRTYAVIANAHL